ncbi:MAG: nucleotide exchange factor GrpE [Rhodospirillaceae bacterium]|jgi:molecular chaperone GrpE|nr:nucleotide exchange factor GrpE [Rhodospirillaceae bacterium]MBT5243022.1 nucleotide exchange factor GrpE [Rhodospirillaceae bacterium]MBT5563247.1 nucleotide exchange factor GrpE [Rhodospirillaceae bacterium]MBT6243561.1 nucleotide exchange factor GrpE [Rhodospirillaceae bacterium]
MSPSTEIDTEKDIEQELENETADEAPETEPNDGEGEALAEDDEPLFGPDASDEELELLDGEEPEGDLSALETELAEVKDQLLRAVAETENVRRRAQREKEDAGKYGIASFAREMLSVSDNLGRALDSERADEEKKANADLSIEELLERFGNFIEGVQMTESSLQKTFERIGIKKLDSIGQPFDPKLHHAMFELEDPGQPSGTVLQVIEAGYVLQDRLLREAKVGVSKGGPKAEAGAPEQESDPTEAEDAASAYEQPVETGAKVDKEL